MWEQSAEIRLLHEPSLKLHREKTVVDRITKLLKNLLLIKAVSIGIFGHLEAEKLHNKHANVNLHVTVLVLAC